MKLLEIIERQRSTFIRQFKDFSEGRNEGVKELLLSYNSEDSGILLNLSRMDYMVKVDGEWSIEEFSPDTYTNHEPIEFVFNNLIILLNPFFWHGCEFTIESANTNFEFLNKWTTKWIDEEEVLESDSDGFTTAIHNVTIPQISNGKAKFTVDFGTSHANCFMELINEMDNHGIEKVEINSFALIN